MQSHASRHFVSEFLKDLHPDLSAPYPKDIIKDEIAEAYGRRGIQKLIPVLDLEDLPDGERAHALRVFNGMLTTQEHKTDAINEGASKPLTRLVKETKDDEVRRLSCESLMSLAMVLPGRVATVNAGAFEALTGALFTSPEAAAGALREFSKSKDGVNLLNTVLPLVVPALVRMINLPKEDGITMKACENAAATLAGIATTDVGIVSCLEHRVPYCMVGLADRGISGDLKFEMALMECLEQVANCLEQICHHRYGKTAAREADAIRVLGELAGMGQWHGGTVKKATSALMGVSVEKEAKVPVMMFAGANLIRLLKVSDQDLVKNARAALTSSAEHLEARKMLEGLMNEEEQRKQLYNNGPLPPSPPAFRYKVELPYSTKPPNKPRASEA